MLFIIMQNFLYVIIGISVALIASRIAVSYFDRLTPYDTQYELESGNEAVGKVVASIYLGVFIMVGLVVGLGLN